MTTKLTIANTDIKAKAIARSKHRTYFHPVKNHMNILRSSGQNIKFIRLKSDINMIFNQMLGTSFYI